MDGLAPPLKLLMFVKRAIEQGRSVKSGVKEYIAEAPNDFSLVVMAWSSLLEQGKGTDALVRQLKSPYRRSLLSVLERGIHGESIYQVLAGLEQELVEACQHDIDAKLARLPFILMIPLLLFQFPAFLLLLFGPLLNNLFHSLGGG